MTERAVHADAAPDELPAPVVTGTTVRQLTCTRIALEVSTETLP